MSDHDDTRAPAHGGDVWDSMPGALELLERAGRKLATSDEVTDDARELIREFVEWLPETPEVFAGADPYLVESLYAGTVECLETLWLGDAAKQRRSLRIPLERVRQAVRDLTAERHVMLDRPPKQLAAWLVEQAEVPQAELAALLAVSPRTLQRWSSLSESTEPSGDDVTRLRLVAKVVDQLRWSMTPTGVVRWLQRPHPALRGKRSPADLLDEPDAYRTLVHLAASTRAMVAS